MTAGFIGFITTRVHKDAYMYVSMIWAAFVLPNIGSALLWGAVDRKIVWQKFFSDSLNSLVTLLAMAFIANLFF